MNRNQTKGAERAQHPEIPMPKYKLQQRTQNRVKRDHSFTYRTEYTHHSNKQKNTTYSWSGMESGKMMPSEQSGSSEPAGAGPPVHT